MKTKQEILDEIKRTAKENGGVPLGRGRFEKETGIKEYHYNKFWPTFGDAQREAGFVANALNSAYADKLILEKLVVFMREIGHFPTTGDLRVKRNSDSDFPSPNTIQRLGGKREIAIKISEYAKENRYNDVVELCKSIIEKHQEKKNLDDAGESLAIGEVYLFKHGRYYKIGKTNDTVRRGTELRIQLPEKLDLIHFIKTDDPSGIEAYWHKRFDAKRMNGEWFDLSSADIKAFKRWRHII
jgi:hypothetical protein